MARFFIALTLCACLICAPSALAEAPGALPDALAPPALAEDAGPLSDLIRLQVIARSDSPADQLEKLRVRDRVRAAAIEVVRGASNSQEAYALLRASRKKLERAARARVEIGEVECPTRVYGRVIVPAGRYRAVRVRLGEGAGRNWWCVLYPGLCGADALESEALAGDQPVVFYSEVMRWAEAMRRDGT